MKNLSMPNCSFWRFIQQKLYDLPLSSTLSTTQTTTYIIQLQPKNKAKYLSIWP